MFKKVTAVLLASMLAVGSLAGCNSSKGQGNIPADNPKTSADAKENNAKPITINMARSAKEVVANKEDIRAELLKQKFNMELKIEEIPQNDFKVKMSMLFAAGDPPDMIDAMREEWSLGEWTEAGYLKGLTQDELKKYAPNYLKLWTEQELKDVYNLTKHTDGKLYYIVGKRPRAVNMTWMYRKDIFDKHNLTFPTTPDDLLKVCKILKEKEGKDPYVLANPVGSTPLFAFSNFFMMYGMPELIPRDLSYVDPITKEFIPYAFSDDRNRAAIIFINKFVTAGNLWKEFATGTQEQLARYKTQGNGFLMWGYPDKVSQHNNYVKDIAPNADWTWAKEMPSGFTDKTFFRREPYQAPDGPAFYSKIPQDKFERFMNYYNWAVSEEGLVFHTFGVEGKTAQKKDGKWMLMDHMQSPSNAQGERFGLYAKGLAGGFGGGYVTIHPDYDKVYNPVYVDVANNFLNKKNYYFHMAPSYQYTADEKSKLADLTTSITSITNEYYLKFAVGQLDPTNDAEWKKYKDALNKVGLQEFTKIRTEAYKRANPDAKK